MGKRIDKLTEQKIKDAADIVSVVGDFVTLRRSGKDYEGLCPFHDDRRLGNFKVSASRNVCSCFSCGIQGIGPVDFLMKKEGLRYGEALRYLAAKFGIWIDDEEPMKIKVQKAAPRTEVKELPLYTFDMSLVGARRVHNKYIANPEGEGATETENPLIDWLRSLPWSEEQTKMLENWLQLYCVGTVNKDDGHSKTKGWTIWWYIDEMQRVRTGKMMAYKTDGHRDKTCNRYLTKDGQERFYTFDYISSKLSRSRNEKKGKRWLWDDNEWRTEQCLFGLHLIDSFPDAEVCIVESEKTAIIAQTVSRPGEKIFLATGSKGNLTRKMLQPLIDKKRWIILYPDVDGLEQWRMMAKQMDYDRIQVSDKVQKLYKPGIDDEKSDIADIIIRIMTTNKEDETVRLVTEKLGRMTPPLRDLIHRLNLGINNGK